jgi:hypothetical protein
LIKTHPRQYDLDGEDEDVNKWSICKSPGSLLTTKCFTKRRISDFIQNLGAGPGLFLLSLRTYIDLFIFLSLLSFIPCLVVYSGNQVDSLDDSGSLSKLFSQFSLGNIGE